MNDPDSNSQSGHLALLLVVLLIVGIFAGAISWQSHHYGGLFSREPEYNEHSLTYWIEHLSDPQAKSALRAMGPAAVPLLAKEIGRDEKVLRALVYIGPPAVPALTNAYLKTINYDQPPPLFRRNTRKNNPAIIKIAFVGRGASGRGCFTHAPRGKSRQDQQV